MASGFSTKRKRKQPDIFSPLSAREEKQVLQVLRTSLRQIPEEATISDDEIADDDEILEDLEEEEEEEDSDSDDEVKLATDHKIKWQQKPKVVVVGDCNQQFGPTKTLSSSKHVKHFFELMFSQKVLTMICKQTNLYAAQRIRIKPDPEWKELSIGELKAFIGCLVAMGLNKQPNLKMYWDQKWKIPVVSNRFTRKRFLSIKKYLHLADNTNITNSTTDRLAKIRPLPLEDQ
jgi:hypothetical protein